MMKPLRFWYALGFVMLLGVQAGAQEVKWDSTYRPKNFQQQLAKFRSAPHSKKDIVFLGNSITARANWSRLLDLPNAKNRGISGDISFGILERLDEVISGKPAKVFLLIGINDISRNIPDTVILGNIKKITSRIKEGSRRTRIYVYTLLPVNSSFGKFKNHYNKDEHLLWLNAEIRKLNDKKVRIIDLYPHFLDADNRLRQELTEDGLHPNAAGYEVFKALIAKPR